MDEFLSALEKGALQIALLSNPYADVKSDVTYVTSLFYLEPVRYLSKKQVRPEGRAEKVLRGRDLR